MYESLYNKVLRYISIRPRSEKEISDYIKRKLYKRVKDSAGIAAVISRILSDLSNLGLLDDEEFAKSWIEWRLNAPNPKGFRVIKSELFVKGINREVIDNLLSLREYVDMEIEGAKRILEKKFRGNIEDPKAKEYLLRRGFL